MSCSTSAAATTATPVTSIQGCDVADSCACSAPFVADINAPQATIGSAYSFSTTVSGTKPIAMEENFISEGLTAQYDDTTGILKISGSPVRAGQNSAVLTLSNACDSCVVVTIPIPAAVACAPLVSPKCGSPLSISAKSGVPVNFEVSFEGDKPTIADKTLPEWASAIIGPAGLTIYGSPSGSAPWPFSVKLKNGCSECVIAGEFTESVTAACVPLSRCGPSTGSSSWTIGGPANSWCQPLCGSGPVTVESVKNLPTYLSAVVTTDPSNANTWTLCVTGSAPEGADPCATTTDGIQCAQVAIKVAGSCGEVTVDLTVSTVDPGPVPPECMCPCTTVIGATNNGFIGATDDPIKSEAAPVTLAKDGTRCAFRMVRYMKVCPAGTLQQGQSFPYWALYQYITPSGVTGAPTGWTHIKDFDDTVLGGCVVDTTGGGT